MFLTDTDRAALEFIPAGFTPALGRFDPRRRLDGLALRLLAVSNGLSLLRSRRRRRARSL